ncbi:MAG: type II toxin-antitoxin system RelB/DinJ family antitoxin [Flexilinea sp.]|nr:type II toxin-antitoxin system RelB/DinJ family antitoxin [Flexilinea sp.]
MAVSSSYTHRIDPALRAQSEALFGELGMSLGTAINVFLKKAVRVGGFPFDVNLEIPNRDTLESMLEAEKIAVDQNIKALSVEDALAELKK